jgi:hypothetical protein
MNIFGYAILNSWFEWNGSEFIGMGSKEVYDSNGILLSSNIEPTGIKWRIE